MRGIAIILVVAVAACATTSQPRVGKAGVYCSDSVGYAVFDFIVASALVYGASEINAEDGGGEGSTAVYLPGAVFAASGVHGLIKRSNCIQHKKQAPPEAWVADRARAEQDERETSALLGAAVLVGGAALAAAAEEDSEETTYTASGTSRYSESRRSVSGSSTLTINGRTYTDSAGGELGKPCSIERNTCSSSYVCNVVIGTSGQCVPK